MRESTRTTDEQAAISKALSVLAIATRDMTIDAGVKRVYMPHLDGYSVSEVERACELLATSDWFPKVGELLRACSKARRLFQDDAAGARTAKALPMPAPNPARQAEWLAKIKATAYRHRMPTAEVHDEQP